MQPEASPGLRGPDNREVRAWRRKSRNASRKVDSNQGQAGLEAREGVRSGSTVGTRRRMDGGQGVLSHPEGKG